MQPFIRPFEQGRGEPGAFCRRQSAQPDRARDGPLHGERIRRVLHQLGQQLDQLLGIRQRRRQWIARAGPGPGRAVRQDGRRGRRHG